MEAATTEGRAKVVMTPNASLPGHEQSSGRQEHLDTQRTYASAQHKEKTMTATIQEREATDSLIPTVILPLAQTKRRRASRCLTPAKGMPAAANDTPGQPTTDTQVESARHENNGAGHNSHNTQPRSARSDDTPRCQLMTDTQRTLAARDTVADGADQPVAVSLSIDVRSICDSLRNIQAMRTSALRDRNALANRSRAFVRRAMGWRMDLPDAERERINDAAAAVVKSIQNHEPQTDPLAIRVAPYVVANEAAQGPSQALLDDLEKQMERLAKTLPVYAKFVEPLKGLGALGLAIIVGEAGNLSDSATPSRLWKRAGLAPKPCYAMTTKDGNEAHLIPRARRSAFWTIADSMFRQDNQYTRSIWPYVAKEIEKAKAEGLVVSAGSKQTADNWQSHGVERPEVKVKAGTPNRTCGHIQKRARRKAEKDMLLDLWKAWHETDKEADGQSVNDTHTCTAVRS
jgi:hypothetical protein